MNNNSYSFLDFLIQKEYLNEIDPRPGCMMIEFDITDKPISSSIVDQMEVMIGYPAEDRKIRFYDNPEASKLKEHFVEYCVTNDNPLAFTLKTL